MNIGGGSEWNDLMYRAHTDVPTDDGTDGMRLDRHGGPQVGANWAGFSNAELNISGNGRACWTQEMSDANSSFRANRGNGGLAFFSLGSASYAFSYIGWRPALELIPNN